MRLLPELYQDLYLIQKFRMLNEISRIFFLLAFRVNIIVKKISTSR